LHVSSGDALRRELARETRLGLQARAAMARGALVSDELMISIVEAQLEAPSAKRGVVLDGFPRSIAQAIALEQVLAPRDALLSGAIYLDVRRAELLQRLAHRRVCGRCQASYHTIVNPPRQVGLCDRCGGDLTQRSDDRESVVSARLHVYSAETEPLLGFYSGRGLLHFVDGSQAIDRVQRDVLAAAMSALSRQRAA
jgi:adenylate kinase